VRHYPSRLAELGGPMPMQIGMLTGPSGPIGSGGGGPPPGALLGLEGEALERALAREAALAAEAGSSAARRRGPGIPGWVFPVLLAAETLERRFQERIDAPGATSGEATLPGEPRPEGAEAPSGHEPYVTILDPQVWPGHGPVGDPADPARMELAPKGLGVPGRSVTPAGIRSGGGRRRLLWWQGDPEGRRKALEEYSDDDVFTADVRQSTDRLLERVVDGTTTPGDVKQLRSGDGLFEARHVNRGNQYRLLFFYWRDAVVVLSAFLKRENHMAREISRADERKARWLKVFGSDR